MGEESGDGKKRDWGKRVGGERVGRREGENERGGKGEKIKRSGKSRKKWEVEESVGGSASSGK